MRYVALLATFALAALPLAASADQYVFTIASVDISVPAPLAPAVTPILVQCEVDNGGTTLAKATSFPIPLTNGSFSGKNIKVVVDSGAKKATSWLCVLVMDKNGVVSAPDKWLQSTPAGKIALGTAVIAPNNKMAWFGNF